MLLEIHFGVISDAKMFDVVVDSLVKRVGHNVIAIAIVTAIIAIFSHLDEATVTTVLVTVPATLPLYRKLNIHPQLLLLITGAGMGVLNLFLYLASYYPLVNYYSYSNFWCFCNYCCCCYCIIK